jgi:beta-lactamase superfamily II metal-dependent hydrolase
MRILGPVDPSAFKRNDNNNPSVVIMARWGNNKVLLTGDAEKEAELQLIGEYGSYLKCDVLKVGHHGSHSSTHQADPANGIMYGFLYYVEPKIGVISCGVDNDYGHPHKETLDELEEFDVEILRTDLLGSIVLTSDGTNITQKTN